MDARELSHFYDGALGQRARRMILTRLRQSWPNVKGFRLLGFGFAAPYLRPFLREAERGIAVSPAEMGALTWPSEKSLTALVQEDCLPFPDAFFDRILVVHGLEGAQALRPLLRQLWRVLAPEGKLLVVAPNRASLWAQVERSPFGQGRPFSRRELDVLLKGALFEPESWQRALYAPPLKGRMLVGSGVNWERFGGRFLTGLSGVHIVEARKSLYAPATPAAVTIPKGKLSPQLKPAGPD
jgi:SAM-dependent methyltransferase